MAKKRGNKKRTYHKPPTQNNIIKKSFRLPFRISQCMIVKNEEKNIERALSWAKSIAFEQIVVDTGSTDRTVEIAERMGAKVFHFNWINDFAAAKNYAIDQASGEWIAFLDADEYLVEEDVIKLVDVLSKIESDKEYREMKTGITCPWVQLNDTGRPFSIFTQIRFFRNAPDIRYVGSIHENLVNLSTPLFNAPEINIMHTGYTDSAYADTGKADRNVNMIQTELDKNPDNAILKCYLADSLLISANMTKDTVTAKKAEMLYRDVLASDQYVPPQLKQGAYAHLITKQYDDGDHNTEISELSKRAYDEYPGSPDFCFFHGRKLYEKGDYNAAWEKLRECESFLAHDIPDGVRAGYAIEHTMLVFFLMVLIAEELGKTAEVIRCATLVLKEDKYQHAMLAPYIAAFNSKGEKTSTDDIFLLLKSLYDFTNTRDKLTVLQAAKSAGNAELVQLVLNILTSDEVEFLLQPQE